MSKTGFVCQLSQLLLHKLKDANIRIREVNGRSSHISGETYAKIYALSQ
jgi:hypothetical protein